MNIKIQKKREEWQSLVHRVSVGDGELSFLDHHVISISGSFVQPVRDTLEVWPPFPLVTHTSLSEGVGDIVAVLEHRDRVDRIYFSRADHSALETVLAAMLEPFPDLRVLSRDETLPVVPDSFLGGSAPRLRVFALSGIPFPGLPKLLLSTTRLVYLRLSDIRILFT